MINTECIPGTAVIEDIGRLVEEEKVRPVVDKRWRSMDDAVAIEEEFREERQMVCEKSCPLRTLVHELEERGTQVDGFLVRGLLC